jgi:hypothetical protein
MPQPTCPNCGMQQTEWLATSGHGYLHDGQLYCCDGCATGAGCTCRTANPGVERTGGPGGSAEHLMTPRDRNGRPLSPEEVRATRTESGPVQLPDTGPSRSSTPAENPRTATTN